MGWKVISRNVSYVVGKSWLLPSDLKDVPRHHGFVDCRIFSLEILCGGWSLDTLPDWRPRGIAK
jgi:hypothetical protein